MARKQKTFDEKGLFELMQDMGFAVGQLKTWGGRADSIDLAIKVPDIRSNFEEAIANVIAIQEQITERLWAPANRESI